MSAGERGRTIETEFLLRNSVSKRGFRLAVLVLILLIASTYRFIGLDNFPAPLNATPPGLEHDEVAHWLINRGILAGEHAIYFTEAYGHEALYHYLQAYFGALVGDHALALRLPSAYFGVLLVAVSYALGRRLFGPQVGLWSAAFLAVLFWPVFYSRLALRAISLPFFSGLAAVLWWQALARVQGSRGEREQGSTPTPPHPPTPAPLLLLSGLAAGLSLHTYMAARAVPIFFALYTLYLVLFHRAAFRRLWQGIALFWLALLLVVAPLAVFLLNNPDAEVRIAEVDAPLRALRAGDFGPVLANSLKITGMFGFRGDPLWRQNIAGRPVFDPLLAALFYLGAALSLWRWRDPRYAFLILWLAAAVIPSLATIDAPSSIRIINLLPVLMLFPLVVGRFGKPPLIDPATTRFAKSHHMEVKTRFTKPRHNQVIHTDPHLSTVWDKLSTKLLTRLTTIILGALLVYHGWSTYHALWQVWPANDEVRFVWQAALTEAAAYLDASRAAGPVAVGGWTPETMDPPTMELTLRRDDLSLRYFDPTQGLIIPNSPDGQPIRIVAPTILPTAPSIRELLVPWERPMGEFTLYELPTRLDVGPEHPVDADFGGQLRFLGYDAPDGCAPGDPCTLVTYWQVTAPADGPRRIFLHAVDEAGEIVTQDDRLGAPAEHWQAGDIIIQLLTLPETTRELRLGVYDPTGGRRLTVDGAEYIMLPMEGEQ
jgi:hypothetical protein